MNHDALFGDDGLRVDAALAEAIDERTAGQRLRDRQAARIGVGLHPLSGIALTIRLHPDAPHDARPDDGGTYPRCGGCLFRVLRRWHNRTYPKCTFPVLAGEGAISRRETHSEASDVRAWWPGCTDWSPVTEVREWVSPA